MDSLFTILFAENTYVEMVIWIQMKNVTMDEKVDANQIVQVRIQDLLVHNQLLQFAHKSKTKVLTQLKQTKILQMTSSLGQSISSIQ